MKKTVHKGLQSVRITRYRDGALSGAADQLAVEEPLEIRIVFGPADARQRQNLAVTMRTPGEDEDLALGFLFTEALIGHFNQVQEIRRVENRLAPESADNIIEVTLRPGVLFDPARLSRHFYTASSCGVCGKASLEMVRMVSCYFPKPGKPGVSPEVLVKLPETLRKNQSLFSDTGGIHAAGLFTSYGDLILSREDVGRHNALDKLIGAALRENRMPLRDHILILSGRVGFELVQKAAMAGVPIMAAVGAPSSLAVGLAAAEGMTLAGFLRDGRFNVYSHPERIENIRT